MLVGECYLGVCGIIYTSSKAGHPVSGLTYPTADHHRHRAFQRSCGAVTTVKGRQKISSSLSFADFVP